jgi:hypothetical protein
VGSLVTEDLRSPTKNLHLHLELTDAALGLLQFGALLRRDARDFTSIYLVLANPAVKSRLTHTEFFGGSRDGFASSNERNSSQSKLSEEWSWHGEQPFIEGLFFTKIR